MRATELPPPTQQNRCSNRPHHLLPSLKELCACTGPDRGTKWTRGRRTSCSLLCSQVVCVPSAAAGTLGEAERRPWVLTRLRGTRHRQVADPYSAVLDSALRQLVRKESTRDGPSNTERHSRGNPVTKSSHSGLKVKEGFPGAASLNVYDKDSSASQGGQQTDSPLGQPTGAELLPQPRVLCKVPPMQANSSLCLEVLTAL